MKSGEGSDGVKSCICSACPGAYSGGEITAGARTAAV